MDVPYTVKKAVSVFENPFDGFKPVALESEIRVDPITGQVTRIVPFRLKGFERKDLSRLVRQSRLKCPFCPESVFQKTSRFPPEFGVPGGRIVREPAVLFPNAFPYARYSAVVVLGPEHYVDLPDFRPERFLSAFQACREYFDRVLQEYPEAVYASVNMNYLPLAGAGLVHPHIQVLAAEVPTTFQATIRDAALRYDAARPGALFSRLVRDWEEKGDRYAGRTGAVAWGTAFAPVGLYDVWGVLPEAPDFIHLDPSLLNDFAEGICRVLRFFGSKRIQSFNLAWYARSRAEGSTFHLVRMVPRVTMPDYGISDINYFERLHRESVTFFKPEKAAVELRSFFR